MNITIIGAGSWGSALAILLSKIANIKLITNKLTQENEINSNKTNKHFLPDNVKFSNNVSATLSYIDINKSDLIVIATPVAIFRNVMNLILSNCITNTPDIIWVCKGFEPKTSLLPSQIFKQIAPDINNFGALLGPSFASDVVNGLPTAITIASENQMFANYLLTKLNFIVSFRVYANLDLIGSEVCSAMKNTLAIATGVCDGLNFGDNARAALITRGIHELKKLIQFYNGDIETLYGLAGIGDIILTATSNLSRNRRFGLKLAENKSIEQIKSEIGYVVEGLQTINELHNISTKYNLKLPIIETLYNIIFEHKNINDSVFKLLSREPKFEF